MDILVLIWVPRLEAEVGSQTRESLLRRLRQRRTAEQCLLMTTPTLNSCGCHCFPSPQCPARSNVTSTLFPITIATIIHNPSVITATTPALLLPGLCSAFWRLFLARWDKKPLGLVQVSRHCAVVLWLRIVPSLGARSMAHRLPGEAISHCHRWIYIGFSAVPAKFHIVITITPETYR